VATVRAAVLETVPSELRIEEVQIDKPIHHEVLVRTVAAGLCHSDLHFGEGKDA
jgi:S-(hydroxymethyl)glutathione dehydrogenase / alcohol dehydrogenase